MNKATAAEIKSDTLTLLICNQINKFLTIKERARRVSRCCQLISKRTKDDLLMITCKKIMKQYIGGQYLKVNASIKLTETNYLKQYPR